MVKQLVITIQFKIELSEVQLYLYYHTCSPPTLTHTHTHTAGHQHVYTPETLAYYGERAPSHTWPHSCQLLAGGVASTATWHVIFSIFNVRVLFHYALAKHAFSNTGYAHAALALGMKSSNAQRIEFGVFF